MKFPVDAPDIRHQTSEVTDQMSVSDTHENPLAEAWLCLKT